MLRLIRTLKKVKKRVIKKEAGGAKGKGGIIGKRQR